MSLAVIIATLIFLVIFRDYIAKVPGLIVWVVDTVGNMPVRKLAVIVLIAVGILIIVRKYRG